MISCLDYQRKNCFCELYNITFPDDWNDPGDDRWSIQCDSVFNLLIKTVMFLWLAVIIRQSFVENLKKEASEMCNMPSEEIAICDECGSEFLKSTSKIRARCLLTVSRWSWRWLCYKKGKWDFYWSTNKGEIQRCGRRWCSPFCRNNS